MIWHYDERVNLSTMESLLYKKFTTQSMPCIPNTAGELLSVVYADAEMISKFTGADQISSGHDKGRIKSRAKI